MIVTQKTKVLTHTESMSFH